MKQSLIKKITKVTPYVISAASIIFAAQFLYFTIDSSFTSSNILWIGLTLLIAIFVFIGLRDEIKKVRTTELDPADYRSSVLVKSILIILASAMLTFFITGLFGTTTIFSASLVCVLFAFVFSNHELEAYSGSVAGMIGAYLCSSWTVAFTTALFTGFVFLLFKPYFKGVGGRGGAIPYVATTLVVRLVYGLVPQQDIAIEANFILPSLIIMISITFLTYSLHEKGILSIVKAAMVVSLVFSALIPVEYYTLTTAMFAGTILGMSSNNRIENYGHLLLVILISFILYVPSYHLLDGIGGKIGILSLLSYYGSVGIKQVVHQLRGQQVSTDNIR